MKRGSGQFLLSFVLLFFPGTVMQAQSYYFRHYQVENGLSNNTVFCSAQDENGFMWFGTKDGLNRFDGYHFKIFQMNNQLSGQFNADYIFSILPQKNGKIWLGAASGLYVFNQEKEKIEPFIDSLKNISYIHTDPAGNIWFLASEVLCRYDTALRKLDQFPPGKYFYATSICTGQDGRLWISTRNGYIKYFDPTQQTFIEYDLFKHSPIPASRRIQKIIAGKDNSIYVGTRDQGIKQLNTITGEYRDLLIYSSQNATIYVRDILQTKTDEFWFATELGIFILNTDTHSFLNLKKEILNPYSLNDNAVYTLCQDKEGGIWAGTYFGGINYYSRQNAIFKKYFPDNTEQSISGNAVREICADYKGNLWIGTEDNGLTKIEKRTGKFTRYLATGQKGSIAYSNIHGLLADSTNLWIGTYVGGIDVMDINSGKIKKNYRTGPRETDLKSQFALCFLKSKTGKIYIGTSSGLYLYRPKRDNFERISIAGNTFIIFIKSLWEDSSGRIWIGTGDHGVYWFDPLTNQSGPLPDDYQQQYNTQNKTINDIYGDHAGNIWVATEGGGVCRLDIAAKKASWYTLDNGLPSNYIFKVLEDNNNIMWVSSSKGLVSLNPSNEEMHIYTQANGLLNDQFNYRSGYKDADGKLYFGSGKGMISFLPEELQAVKNFAPPIYITGFQVYDKELSVAGDNTTLKKSISYTDEIVLAHDQSTISIDFAALSFISPKMTEYSYRMVGLTNEWTSAKSNTKAHFTNLSPGEYTFEVRATANGINSQNIRRLTIHLRPPFWMTGWAILIYISLGIAIIYILFRNYHKRQQFNKEKELYKSKIDFFTNVAHEIRTPLTLIKGPVENLLEKESEMPDVKEDIECLSRNTNRLMDLATQLLDFRQTEIKTYSLGFENVNIIEILRETYLSFTILAKRKHLQYELITSSKEVNTLADKDALQKIFSNLIGNAVKYAEKSVQIRLLEPANGQLIFEFENDGHIIPSEAGEKIFEPFFRLKETVNQKGAGIGLTLARSLSELHQGRLYLLSSQKTVNVFVLELPYQPVVSS